jgi:hypothetical protein
VAISFIGAGAQTVGTTSGGAVASSWPTGYSAVTGDLALLIVAGRPTNTTEPSAPAGWAKKHSRLQEVGTNDLCVVLFYRVLQSGDSAPSVTCPAAWSGNAGGLSTQIAVYRGVDTTTPFDAAGATGIDQIESFSAFTTWTPQSVTTETNGAWALSIVASADDNALSLTTANGYSARMSGASYDTTSGGDHAVALADKEIVTAGSSGATPTWTQTAVGADAWVSIHTSLRPAAEAIQFDGDVVASSTSTASLATSIAMTAAVLAQATVTAPLTLPKPLASSTSTSTTSSAGLSTSILATAQSLAASASSAQLFSAIAMSATVSGQATASAPLTLPKPLESGASSSSASSAGLSTTIRAAAQSSTTSTSSAQLFSAIAFSASAIAEAAASGNVQTPGAALEAGSASTSTASASIETTIRIAAGAIAQSTVSSSMSTSIRVAGASQAAAGSAAGVTTGIVLFGAATSASDLAGAMGSAAATMNASSGATSVAAASLQSAVRLTGAATTTSASSSAASTSIALQGSMQSVAGGSAGVTTSIRLGASSSGLSSSSGAVASEIRMQSVAMAGSLLAGDFDTAIALGAFGFSEAAVTAALEFTGELQVDPRYLELGDPRTLSFTAELRRLSQEADWRTYRLEN